jgi:hypothetical protein
MMDSTQVAAIEGISGERVLEDFFFILFWQHWGLNSECHTC